jgi:hypothetical protein
MVAPFQRVVAYRRCVSTIRAANASCPDRCIELRFAARRIQLHAENMAPDIEMLIPFPARITDVKWRVDRDLLLAGD